MTELAREIIKRRDSWLRVAERICKFMMLVPMFSVFLVMGISSSTKDLAILVWVIPIFIVGFLSYVGASMSHEQRNRPVIGESDEELMLLKYAATAIRSDKTMLSDVEINSLTLAVKELAKDVLMAHVNNDSRTTQNKRRNRALDVRPVARELFVLLSELTESLPEPVRFESMVSSETAPSTTQS